MPTTHGAPPRGLEATRSPLFQGRFGRMFRNLAPADFGADEDANNRNLKALAAAMSAEFDPPTDGPDPEESGIPALYTYFGQFIDHDITFDPVTTLTAMADPDGLTDFRNPGLNLDNLYGRGPSDQPYMYKDDTHLWTGGKLAGGDPAATDLPRFEGRALIGDPRNDENAIVSQLQGMMIRFHNRAADDNPDLAFEDIQQIVRFHYQYVILHDFLPRIVSPDVLAELRTDGRFDQGKMRFFHWQGDPFMPVEFATAAYRLGHSMIRPGYRLNDTHLVPIFKVPDKAGDVSLAGFQPMGADRAIDWGRFIDIDERDYGVADPKDEAGKAANHRRLQFAYRLDTSLVNPLSALPASVAPDAPPSLGERNLKRGWRLGLPSGQAVARAMGVKELSDEEIRIAKAMDAADVDPKDVDLPIVAAVNKFGGDGSVFAGNCPVWTYILAEAAHHRRDVAVPVRGGRTITTPQLGPVGGRIVAEVFLGLLYGDGSSLLSLDPLWAPADPGFRLKDLVLAALGKGERIVYRAGVAKAGKGGVGRTASLPQRGAQTTVEDDVARQTTPAKAPAGAPAA